MDDYRVICDRTGFKLWASECKLEWNGAFVRRESWEPRQPQDLIRAFPDPQAVPIPRPEGGDRFITNVAVTWDDL